MSFYFTQRDNCNELPEDIKKHLQKMIQHRLEEFKKNEKAFEDCQWEVIKNYCHKVEGVACSYNLNKLDEIIRYIHDLAHNEESQKLQEILPLYRRYLAEISHY